MPAVVERLMPSTVSPGSMRERYAPKFAEAPRMRLNVGELAAVQLASAIACEVLDDVDLLASTVITMPG